MKAIARELLRENIRAGFAAKGWTLRAGAIACGVSYHALRHSMSPDSWRAPQLATLRRLAAGLGLSVRQLLGEAPRLERAAPQAMHHAGGAPFAPRRAVWALCGKLAHSQHATNDPRWVSCIGCLAALHVHGPVAGLAAGEDAA